MFKDDLVFKALADPTRRFLLDLLFKHDGRSLLELRAQLKMTRFGAMKHLRVLEAAGLVVARRSGRKKFHFLNAVPIRMIHDRWIDKYTEPWAASLTDLKKDLETTMEKVFEIYIKTTPERLWRAITDPEMRKKYNFGVAVDSDWKPGSSYKGTVTPKQLRAVLKRRGVAPDHGTVDASTTTTIFEGENLEVDPPRRLVQSFRALWSEDIQREGVSRVTWEIEQIGDSCRLTIIHDQLREGANAEMYGGWPMILSGLKTLLETGKTLTTPGSLKFLESSRRQSCEN